MSIPRERLLALLEVSLFCATAISNPLSVCLVGSRTARRLTVATFASCQKKCQIWATTFNPNGMRMGNKVLRAKLRGPGLAGYYPRRVVTMRDFQKQLEKLSLTFDDEKEDDRLEKIEEYVEHLHAAYIEGGKPD
jgi:hypothetical protein